MNSTIFDLKEAMRIKIDLDPCYQVLVTKVNADEYMAITDDYKFVIDLFFEKDNIDQSICLRLMVNTTQFTDEDVINYNYIYNVPLILVIQVVIPGINTDRSVEYLLLDVEIFSVTS